MHYWNVFPIDFCDFQNILDKVFVSIFFFNIYISSVVHIKKRKGVQS
jgi:small basic protein